MTAIYAIRDEETTETHGKAFLLEGGAKVGNTFTLSILRDMVMSQGVLHLDHGEYGNLYRFVQRGSQAS